MIFFLFFGGFGSVKFFGYNKKVLEFWCGVLPIVILFFVVFFSFGLICYDSLVVNNVDEGGFFSGSKIDVKVVGRQWFWVYEYSGLGS